MIRPISEWSALERLRRPISSNPVASSPEATICPIVSMLQCEKDECRKSSTPCPHRFREEVLAHITGAGCPFDPVASTVFSTAGTSA